MCLRTSLLLPIHSLLTDKLCSGPCSVPHSDSVTRPQVVLGLRSSSTEHFTIKIKLIDVGDSAIVGMCHSLWDELPPELHSPLHLC